MRCCRSEPRCRACPFALAAEARALRQLAAAPPKLPAHLAGVPPCLHKYEPLFREPAVSLPVAEADAAA